MKTTSPFSPRRILCALDFSDLSALALKYAVVGARAYEAELTVLQATHFEMPPYFTRAQSSQLLRQWKAAQRSVRARVAEHVRGTVGSAARGLPIRYLVVDQPPAEAIVAAMEQGRHDLVVMGTHGRTGTSRFLLGSVTEHVVRQAPVPVFVVRQKEHEFIDPGHPEALPKLERILCPVDDASGPRACVAHAASIARQFDATLTVLSTMKPADRLSVIRATRELCSWIPKPVSRQCAVRPLVRRGDAVEEILRFAGDERQDLIVLGAQARRGLRSLFFGETMDLVLRHAQTPILVVPVRPGRSGA